MAIDTSIYAQQAPVTTPNVGDTMQQVMTLKNLGLQNQNAQLANQQAQLQMQNQQAIRQAYANNVGEDGTVDQKGVLSDLARNAPQAYMQTAQGMTAMQKAQAEATTAKMAALHQTATITAPNYDYLLNKLSDEQAAQAYPTIVHQMAQQGVDIGNLPPTWNRDKIQQAYDVASKFKEQMDNAQTAAKTNEANANAAAMPSKIAAQQFGRSSANVALSGQYTQDVKPIRNSQIFMQQMLDSYKNQTPQGDAALVLNNFKIRNPQVADVNSIEEMKSSQAVPDAWKNKINQALNGGFDEQTRNNLIRDGISAYRANMTSLAGIQKRYQARQLAQGVGDPTLTYEPASEDTNKEAMALQQKIGAYVPPIQRPGMLGSIANMVGLGGPKSANADTPKAPSAGGFSLSEIRAELARRKAAK